MDESLEAQCGQVREFKIPGNPVAGWPSCVCDFYLQELDQVLTVNMGEKISVLPAEKGKKG